MSRRWLTRLAEPFRNEDFRALRKHLFPGDQLSLPAPLAVFVSIVAVGLAVYTLYIAFHVTPGPIKTRAIHLAVTIPLTFLLYPALERWRGRSPRFFDYALAALARRWRGPDQRGPLLRQRGRLRHDPDHRRPPSRRRLLRQPW